MEITELVSIVYLHMYCMPGGLLDLYRTNSDLKQQRELKECDPVNSPRFGQILGKIEVNDKFCDKGANL